MKRWEVTAPYGWPGGWEGRVQVTETYDTKADVCGHVHESRAEAERCADSLADRLNYAPMPSDYYLG